MYLFVLQAQVAIPAGTELTIRYTHMLQVQYSTVQYSTVQYTHMLQVRGGSI